MAQAPVSTQKTKPAEAESKTETPTTATAPASQLEALQNAAAASRRGLGVSSDSLAAPSAELEAQMTHGTRAPTGSSDDAAFDEKKLAELWDEVQRLNQELSDVMHRRDVARDAYDREESKRITPSHGESVVAYNAAQNKIREQRARLARVRRERELEDRKSVGS